MLPGRRHINPCMRSCMVCEASPCPYVRRPVHACKPPRPVGPEASSSLPSDLILQFCRHKLLLACMHRRLTYGVQLPDQPGATGAPTMPGAVPPTY